jgi:flagellin-like hook-associated protein FlgL
MKIVKLWQVAQEARKTCQELLLVIEFTEEFTTGNVNTLSTGSISNDYPQGTLSSAQDIFHNAQFHEPPISDAGMAAEISRLIKSQIICQANTAVYAQTSALNASALSFIRA